MQKVKSPSDNSWSSVLYNFGCICLSVCQTVTLDSLDVLGSSYLHIRYIVREYGSSLYMKVIGSRSRSQEQKRVEDPCFLQCKTSVSSNSGFMKHGVTKFACIMGFSAMADRLVWPPSLSHDRKWPHVTKCTHSQVVGLRLEGTRVIMMMVVYCLLSGGHW